MPVLPDLAVRLDALAASSDCARELGGQLDELLRTAAGAVPSCIAVSLTVTQGGLPVTITALTVTAGLESVRSSLALPMRSSAESAAAELLLYAASPGAFDAVAADLAVGLAQDSRPLVLDGHLQLPLLAGTSDLLVGSLGDVSAVDQALGVLLDRGYPLEQGGIELERLATAAGDSVPAAARQLLAELSTPA